jgi:hypothetical protein
MIATIASLVFL